MTRLVVDARRGARGVGRRRRRRDVGVLDVDEHVLAVGRSRCRCRRRRGRGRPTPSRDLQRVVAVLAVDRVAGAGARVERVVAEAAEERVGLVAAGEACRCRSRRRPPRRSGRRGPARWSSVSSPPNVLSSNTSDDAMLSANGRVRAVVADAVRRRRLSVETSSPAPSVVLDAVEAVVAVHVVGAVAVVPDERVVAVPPFTVSLPRLPTMRSPPAPPLSVSAPVPPWIRSAPSPVVMVSLPGPASIVHRDRRAGRADERVVARERVDVQALGARRPCRC